MDRLMDQRMPRKAVKRTPHSEGHAVQKTKTQMSALKAWTRAMRGWMLGKDRTEEDWAKLRRAQHDLPADATTRGRRARLRMQKANRRRNRGGTAVRHSVQR